MVLLPLVGVPNSVKADDTLTVDLDDADVVDEQAAEVLAKDLDLKYDVALARILAQDVFEKVAVEANNNVDTDTWGGSWIDHQDQGKLKIGIKGEMPGIREIAPSAVASRVEITQVEFSVTDLERVESDVLAILNGSRIEISRTGIRPQGHRKVAFQLLARP